MLGGDAVAATAPAGPRRCHHRAHQDAADVGSPGQVTADLADTAGTQRVGRNPGDLDVDGSACRERFTQAGRGDRLDGDDASPAVETGQRTRRQSPAADDATTVSRTWSSPVEFPRFSGLACEEYP